MEIDDDVAQYVEKYTDMGWNAGETGEIAIRHEAMKQEIACSLEIPSHGNSAMKTPNGKALDQAIRFLDRVFLQAR